MFDIVAIGDAFLDHIIYLPDDLAAVKDGEICFERGKKVVVESFEDHIGGNALIAASAMKRLGLNVALITYLGQDEAGERLKKILEDAGIKCSTIKEGQTNRSAIIQAAGDRSIFSLHAKRNYQVPEFPESKWLYLSSMAQEAEAMLPEIYKIIKTKNLKTVFAPGTAQLQAGLGKLALILRETQILCLNQEEAQELTGSHSNQPSDLLRALQKLGPQIIAMTAGEKGAYAAQGQSYWFAPAMKVNVVDATGAGDSFAGAFVAALILNNSVEEALKWGIVNSTANIMVRGGQAGLLDRNQIKETIKSVETKKLT